MPQLSDDRAVDAAILARVDRYRLTVFEALRQLPELKGVASSALRHHLRRLCREGVLGRAALYHNRLYFFRANADVIGRSQRPLSETAKVRSYGMLAFCCLGATARTKLNHEDLAQLFPELPHQSSNHHFYQADHSEPVSCGWLRIDCGGHGRWDRVLAKCHRDLLRFRHYPSIERQIELGNFEITLMTALPQKAQRLQQALKSEPSLLAGNMRLCVLPDLVQLILPAPLERR